MNARTVNKAIKNIDELVELVDTQVEALNGIVDSFREFQEFLEAELENLKKLAVK